MGFPGTLDLARQGDYFWALLPEIVLALWAMGVLLADVFQKGNRSQPSAPWLPWVALAGLAAAFVANLPLVTMTLGARNPLQDTSMTGMVAVDGFRGLSNCLFLISGAFAILLSTGYLDRRGINRGEFHALVLFSVLGMMLMAGASDLMLLFIGLEVMSVAIYVLVGFDRLDARSAEASLKYFLLGAFTSAIFLYGIALVWGATGSSNVRTLLPLLLSGDRQEPMLLAGMALVLVGFGFKVAAIPFHMWTPDAYEGAPTPVTALMATGVKAAAFVSLARVFLVGFSGHYDVWSRPLFMLAAVTMVLGNLLAMTQGSIKRMLAYSSVAHAGYLLAAVLAGFSGGAAALLFYLFIYTLMTAGAFGIVIANARGADERVTLEDYAGLARQKPLLAGMFSIFLLSLAGFPLTAGFLGKFYILRALVQGGISELAVILVLASLVSYFYYLRVIVVMYMRPARTDDDHQHAGLPGPAMGAVMTAAVLVVLLFFTAGIRWGTDTNTDSRIDSRWSLFRVAEEGQWSLGQWGSQALQAQEGRAAAGTAPAGPVLTAR
ncbi:MAG TPA: NADH-quinone oxidoreductase subunit N [Longimicrobium sp.]|nr:NADH-quinone oxidoreductase subunit N [Longimicrobium sp.]